MPVLPLSSGLTRQVDSAVFFFNIWRVSPPRVGVSVSCKATWFISTSTKQTWSVSYGSCYRGASVRDALQKLERGSDDINLLYFLRAFAVLITWALIFHRFGEESMARIIRWLEKHQVPLDSSVLDIGTGNGVLLIELVGILQSLCFWYRIKALNAVASIRFSQVAAVIMASCNLPERQKGSSLYRCLLN